MYPLFRIHVLPGPIRTIDWALIYSASDSNLDVALVALLFTATQALAVFCHEAKPGHQHRRCTPTVAGTMQACTTLVQLALLAKAICVAILCGPEVWPAVHTSGRVHVGVLFQYSCLGAAFVTTVLQGFCLQRLFSTRQGKVRSCLSDGQSWRAGLTTCST